MTDPRDELATLLADTLAWCHAFAAAGGRVLPMGELAELPPPDPADRAEPARARVEPRPEPSRVAPTPAPAPIPPRVAPTPARPPAPMPPAPAPPSPAAPAAANPARAAPPTTPPRVEPRAPAARVAPRTEPRVEPVRSEPRPEPPSEPAPLGGKWAAFLRDPQLAVDEAWESVGDCRRCPRCSTRQRLIRGVGSARAEILVVTDPPSAEAEQRNAALTQRDAEMLANMAQRVLNRRPAEVYVVPALFCAAPHLPTASEITACRPQLLRVIETIRPRAVLALGDLAASVLLDPPTRGAFGMLGDIPVMPTWHPAWLHANPGDKRAAMEHLQALRRRLDA